MKTSDYSEGHPPNRYGCFPYNMLGVLVHSGDYFGCAVCLLRQRETHPILRTLCGHCFHTVCIKVHFQNKSRCPVCRFDLQSGIESYIMRQSSVAQYTALRHDIAVLCLRWDIYNKLMDILDICESKDNIILAYKRRFGRPINFDMMTTMYNIRGLS